MNGRWRRWRERIRALVLPCPEPSTGQMLAISAEIDARPWLPRPAEREPDWAAEARLRGRSPHLYASFDSYWTAAWREFYRESFRIDRERIRHRAECGLPPLQIPTLTDLPAVAA